MTSCLPQRFARRSARSQRLTNAMVIVIIITHWYIERVPCAERSTERSGEDDPSPGPGKGADGRAPAPEPSPQIAPRPQDIVSRRCADSARALTGYPYRPRPRDHPVPSVPPDAAGQRPAPLRRSGGGPPRRAVGHRVRRRLGRGGRGRAVPGAGLRPGPGDPRRRPLPASGPGREPRLAPERPVPGQRAGAGPVRVRGGLQLRPQGGRGGRVRSAGGRGRLAAGGRARPLLRAGGGGVRRAVGHGVRRRLGHAGRPGPVPGAGLREARLGPRTLRRDRGRGRARLAQPAAVPGPRGPADPLPAPALGPQQLHPPRGRLGPLPGALRAAADRGAAPLLGAAGGPPRRRVGHGVRRGLGPAAGAGRLPTAGLRRAPTTAGPHPQAVRPRAGPLLAAEPALQRQGGQPGGLRPPTLGPGPAPTPLHPTPGRGRRLPRPGGRRKVKGFGPAPTASPPTRTCRDPRTAPPPAAAAGVGVLPAPSRLAPAPRAPSPDGGGATGPRRKN